jgi:hypothetical protein
MPPWVRRLLAFAAALLLALPPGWCCLLPRLRAAAASPTAKRHCCSEEPTPRRDCPAHDRGNGPLAPCCCHTDPALPPGPEAAPADLQAAPLPGVVVAHVPLVGEFAQDFSLFITPPRLQLLHCVWRC